MESVSAGQRWRVTWHGPGNAPQGSNHGAAGVCVTDDTKSLVLISTDKIHWGFPAGRPEGAETLRQTLDREMHEEACVTVRDALLLGYARSECIDGHQRGTVLVRSLWRAVVSVEPWTPEFEIPHRKLVPVNQGSLHVDDENPVVARVSLRALVESGLPMRFDDR